jgi:hypothetical protein
MTTYSVCNTSFSCIDIPNVVLHISLVYVYKHLTKVTKVLLWLMCFLWLTGVPNLSNGACVGPTFEIYVTAKVPFPTLGS